MVFQTLDERLSQLEAILDNLRVENEQTPIMVEGRNDIESLHQLGITGKILSINIGKSLLTFCEQYARHHQKVILLMDWDPRGRRLRLNLKKKFAILEPRVEVNDEFWLELRKLAFPEIKDIQSLATLMARLRDKKRLKKFDTQ